VPHKPRKQHRPHRSTVFPTSEELQRLFDDALRSDDPRPSLAAYKKLARQFQETVNRHDNAERERGGPVPLDELNDVAPGEEQDKRVRKFNDAVKNVTTCACELEECGLGGYKWPYRVGTRYRTISLHDIQEFLGRINPGVPAPPAAAHGLPWRRAAREIGDKIKDALRKAGFRRSLKTTRDGSVVTEIGAAVLSWIYGIEIESAGFVAAVRRRNRKKPHYPFAATPPRAKRIGGLP
jgi:hypothetical protein